jgi:cobalt-zinc-cadmium efflux system outer membrane protein
MSSMRRKAKLLLCATGWQSAVNRKEMPDMKTKSFILAGLLAAVSLPPALPAFAQEQAITPPSIEKPATPAALVLDQAIAWALEKSPVLGASSSRADAATASRSQAGALPNPELSVEAENIYGDGPYDGLDGAEITYGVSQLVELPGKRGNRVRVADAEKTKIHYARDAARLDLIRDVTTAYAELAAAQQEVSILEEERNLATEVRDSVAAKVQAGKEPPIQKNKAEIELSASNIALERARRNFTAKKQVLSSLMGGDTGDFTVTMNSLPPLGAPEPLETYRTRLPQTPDIQSLDADVNQAKAGLSLEKANAMPDPTFNFGVRDFREDDSQAFVAGVSIPFPVFNLNRAGVERAGHDLNAAMLDQRGAQLSIDTQLTEIYGDFTSAYGEASALKESVLPGAEEAFSFARQGYEAGKLAISKFWMHSGHYSMPVSNSTKRCWIITARDRRLSV